MYATLSDSHWTRLASFLSDHPHIYFVSDAHARRFIHALSWILRTGSPWRALPAELGRWNSVYRRWRDWLKKGVFLQLFNHLKVDADWEWLSVDSTVIRAHMCAAGASYLSGGQGAQALGRSRGGFSTKLHVKVDALGNPLELALTPGQTHDSRGWPLLRTPEDAQALVILGDSAYDSNAIREDIASLGAQAVISNQPRRIELIPYDEDLYKARHVVECFINKIKHYRRVFTRYDKLGVTFLSWTHLASSLIWLR